MKSILCYGDSNTYGYVPETGDRYPESVRWPARLGKMLGSEYEVFEHGLNSRTTVMDDPYEPGKNGLTSLIPTLMCYELVDVVILMLGSNDMKFYFNMTEEKLKENLGILVDEIKGYYEKIYKSLPRIILVAPPEIGVWPGSTDPEEFWKQVIETSRRFPEIYREVAEKKGVEFFNTQEVVKPSPVDNLHLTTEGHKDLAAAFYEYLKD